MKKRCFFFGTALLLSLFLLTSIDTGITGEKSSNKKGYLGVSIEELDRHTKKELKADFGVVISRVEIDSPADEFGLMEDDVIQTVNGIKIRRPHTLTRIVRKIKPGEKAKIVLIRDGQKKNLSVVIGSMKKGHNYSYSFSGPNKEVFAFFERGNAYLGVHLQELNDDLAHYFGVKPEQGALIMEVEKDSPAEQAGLKSGDVITKIDDEKITNPDDVVEIISDFEEDDEVELAIVRRKKKQTIKVTLEERKHHGNFLFAPEKRKKNIRLKSGKDKKLIELMEDDIIINSPKSHINIIKNGKEVKMLKGTI